MISKLYERYNNSFSIIELNVNEASYTSNSQMNKDDIKAIKNIVAEIVVDKVNISD